MPSSEALRAEIRKNAPWLKPESDFYIKSLRVDNYNFFFGFIRELINPELRFQKRKRIKQDFVVRGDGPFKRHEGVESSLPVKISQYSPQEKMNHTKAQSTSFGYENFYPSVFGFNQRSILIGVLFEEKNVLPSNYLLTEDFGTVKRPFDFFTENTAREFANRLVGKKLFSSKEYPLFKQNLSASLNKTNEVLARLQWNCDETCRIFIYTDNLESRLLAKHYAEYFSEALYRAGKCAADYEIPVCFYTPENPDLLFRQYTQQEFDLDCFLAREIYSSPLARVKKYQEKNYEFLLGLPQEELMQLMHQGFATTLLTTGNIHIFRLILKKTNFNLAKVLDQEINKFNAALILYHALLSDYQELTDYLYQHIDLSSLQVTHANTHLSPLMAAVEKNNLEWVKRLREFSWINFESEDPDTYTALEIAIDYGYLEAAELLIGAGVSIRSRAFNLAAQYGHEELLKLMLAKGVDPNTFNDRCHATALHYAAERNHYTIAKLLLANGFDTNEHCVTGETSLHLAAQFSHTRMIKLLMENGADPHAVDQRGQTPLYLAAYLGRTDIVRELLNDNTLNPFQPCLINYVKCQNETVDNEVINNFYKQKNLAGNERIIAVSPMELAEAMGNAEIMNLFQQHYHHKRAKL